MINTAVLAKIKCGICAVGYLTVAAEEYAKDPSQPFFKVVGTGFLVRETTAITNRHVIEKLEFEQAENGFPNKQKHLLFVHPVRGGWATTFCEILGAGIVNNPELDVAFVDVNRPRIEPFQQCLPLELNGLPSLSVGHSVGLCGYPYGTSLLKRNGKIFRFGPVLQQGYVSALAPYDGMPIEEILLDVRIAGGMSGSPVFRPDDGGVVGLAYASWESTTALAIPVDRARMDKWLESHDRSKGAKARGE